MQPLGKFKISNRHESFASNPLLAYPLNFDTHCTLKAKTELDSDICRSFNRRILRNLTNKKSENTLSRYNIRSNSSLSKHCLQKTPSSGTFASLTRAARSSSDNFSMCDNESPQVIRNLSYLTNFSQLSQKKKNKQESSVFKRAERFRRSFTKSLLSRFTSKDDLSDDQLIDMKKNKFDYDEILTHIALGYTFQKIEESACLEDKDWSGSYIPSINDDFGFLYVGGYGLVDGVTEYNNVNLAAKKYQHIDFTNDESLEALSHMYGMQHLLNNQISASERKSQSNIVNNET